MCFAFTKNIIFFYEKKIFLHLSQIFYLPFVFAVVDVVAVVVVVGVVIVVVVGLLSISQKTPAKPSSQKHWVFIKLSA